MIVGIDEVGRGCWAGPLVAGAVALERPINGLKDSKILTKLQRTRLAREIHQKAAAVGLGWVSAQEVDVLGLTEAVRVAMQRALHLVTLSYDEVIIDGSYNFLPNESRARAVIKADGSVPEVSAASIVAKVARDTWMCEQAAMEFPVYGFEKHVGYGTKFHQDMLKLHGVSTLHRQSYKPIQRLL
jgi:ribonuclease HII